MLQRRTLLHVARNSKMSFAPPYRYIDGETLAKILKDPAEKSKVAIVDVRDDDFDGGNIVSAQNVPSSQFESRVGDLVQELKGKEKVIVHCALSQQRGPKAARMYAEARAAQAQESGGTQSELLQPQAASAGAAAADGNAGQQQQEVLVLRDGFGGFGPKYFNDPDLVENWDAESWEYR